MQAPKIPAFNKARVVVAGDVMLDRYWHGPTGRISPEAPVPVVRVNDIEEDFMAWKFEFWKGFPTEIQWE